MNRWQEALHHAGRRSAMNQSNTSRVSRDSLRITSVHPPGWQPLAEGALPRAGETVYCTDGPAEVVKLLGRTSDGSRLLELRCSDRPQPFFASSANVLVRDPANEPSPFMDPSSAVGGL
jgi:hypothetical protein